MSKMLTEKLVVYTTLAVNALMLITSIALLIVSGVSNHYMNLGCDAC